jgi:competence protein ComFB
MTGAAVELLRDGDLVPMVDHRWQNPYDLAEHTRGTYLFWPRAIRADRSGEMQVFDLEIRAEREGFEPFRHLFRLELVSEEGHSNIVRLDREHVLPDLYMFPA